MKGSRTKNMTEGSPLKLMVEFIIPLLLGLLFQQMYSMVDSIVVGKFLGVDALAGVGSTGAINFLVLGFCTGICSGFAIPVAQKFGQQDLPGLRRVVGSMIGLGTILSVVITAVTALLCRKILIWMNNPAETFEYAYIYILIIFLGIPSMMLYNILSGIIRSLGDSRTPLYFLVLSSVLNVVLDLVLILWAKMGVAGAAVATVLSQVVSGVLCLVLIIRRFPLLKLSRDDMKMRRHECMLLLSMGVPMGLQYSITAIGSTLLQTSVNNLGAQAMAAVTSGAKVHLLLCCPYEAIGTAAATFTGQNVGAGKLDRVHSGIRATAAIGLVYSALAVVIVRLWGGDMLRMFLDRGETEILNLSTRFLRINCWFYSLLLFVILLRFSIQGMGFSRQAIFAGVFELIARAVISLVIVPRFGFDGVCFADASAWVLADLFLVPMYFYGLKSLGRYNPYASLES